MLRSPIARSTCSSPSRTSGAPGRIRARALVSRARRRIVLARQRSKRVRDGRAKSVAGRLGFEAPERAARSDGVRIERQRLAVGRRRGGGLPGAFLLGRFGQQPAHFVQRVEATQAALRAAVRRVDRERDVELPACRHGIARLDCRESGRERGAQRRIDALLNGLQVRIGLAQARERDPDTRDRPRRHPPRRGAACHGQIAPRPRIPPNASRGRRGGLRRRGGVRRPAASVPRVAAGPGLEPAGAAGAGLAATGRGRSDGNRVAALDPLRQQEENQARCHE